VHQPLSSFIAWWRRTGVEQLERETRIRWHNLGTTAKQVVMVWACAAKRRQSLGEDMYGVWSRGWQTKR